MLAKKPKVPRPSHRRSPSVNLRQLVFLIEAATVQKKIDLTHLEATDLEIDLWCKFQNLGEFEGELRPLPYGIVGDPVERKPQRPQLGLGQVRES